MKKLLLTLTIAVLAISQTALASFTDVDENHHYYTHIDWLQDQEVIEGYGDGKFKPEANVTRAEFLKMLYETIGMKELEADLPFSDVPNNEWYTKYIKEAYATEIINGYPDKTFKPDNKINYAEATKIIANGFFPVDGLYGTGESYVPCFMDLSQMSEGNNWYWKYFSVSEKLCAIPEYLAGERAFDPGAFITRGDTASMLYRAKTIKDHNFQKFDGKKEPAKIRTSMNYEKSELYENDDYGFSFTCPQDLHILDIYGEVYIDEEKVDFNEMLNGFQPLIRIGPKTKTKNDRILGALGGWSSKEISSENYTATQYKGTSDSYIPYQTLEIIMTVFTEKGITLTTYGKSEIGDEILDTIFFY